MADNYSQRFDINIPEWRVLATLGDREPVTAQEIVASTRTHKSTISRAVDSLVARNWIEKIPSETDRREIKLRFTGEGKDQFIQLTELVLGYENTLMASLDQKARADLNSGIDALESSLKLKRSKVKRQ